MRHFLADWKKWSPAERVIAVLMLVGTILVPVVAATSA